MCLTFLVLPPLTASAELMSWHRHPSSVKCVFSEAVTWINAYFMERHLFAISSDNRYFVGFTSRFLYFNTFLLG